MGPLFWSRNGNVACADHVPDVSSPRWIKEQWTAIDATSLDRATYRCQQCSSKPHKRTPRVPQAEVEPETLVAVLTHALDDVA